MTNDSDKLRAKLEANKVEIARLEQQNSAIIGRLSINGFSVADYAPEDLSVELNSADTDFIASVPLSAGENLAVFLTRMGI